MRNEVRVELGGLKLEGKKRCDEVLLKNDSQYMLKIIL